MWVEKGKIVGERNILSHFHFSTAVGVGKEVALFRESLSLLSYTEWCIIHFKNKYFICKLPTTAKVYPQF